MANKYVDKTGNDANNGSSLLLAKLTLAGGESVASNGDTIIIGAGTWVENFGTGKNLTYQGAGMTSTTINGILPNYTVENCTYNDLTISLNANIATYVRGDRTFLRVRFLGNGYGSLGSFYFYGGAFKATYSTFHRVVSSVYSFAGLPSYQIYGCSFYSCSIIYFGFALGYTSYAKNCAAYNTQAIGFNANTGQVDHCVSNYAWGTNGVDGNVTADPLFINGAGGDLRLATNSPAINAGQP